MNIQEGRGYVLRTGTDTPLAGWLSASQVDVRASWREEPFLAIQMLGDALRVFPGGLDFIWDLASSDRVDLKLLGLLGHLPGLRLHVQNAGVLEGIRGPLNAWYHAPQTPSGLLGQLWRQGWLGWVPDTPDTWSLPCTGRVRVTPEPLESGCLWGECALLLGALSQIEPEPLVKLLSESQASLERALSLRINDGAWPATFPFQRRRAGWKLGLLGGWEYQSAGGSWEDAAARVQELARQLSDALHAPIHVGACMDLETARLLGRQAMREGLPWRASLQLPPASEAFSPAFGAMPLRAASCEARTLFPAPMARVLDTPPVAWLRMPDTPQENAVEAFSRMLQPAPAIHWLPPGVSPPGSFFPDLPWAPCHAYPPLADPTQALQPGLFDELD